MSLNSELYKQASQVAAGQGKTVDHFLDEALQMALSIASVRQTICNGLPVMLVGEHATKVNLTEVRESLQEDGF